MPSRTAGSSIASKKAIYTANSLGAAMAPGEGAEFQRKAILTFYAMLLVSGVLIYWVWGILYDTWYPFTRGNIGIYTVYIPLIVFGIIGILLYRKKPVKA